MNDALLFPAAEGMEIKEKNMEDKMKEEEKVLSPQDCAETEETGETAADAGQKEAAGDCAETKPGWEEILSDPEYRACYDSAVQNIVQRRLRGRHEAEEMLSRLQPVLQALNESYGVDTGDSQLDAGALAEMILEGLRKKQEDKERVFKHLEELMGQEAELKRSFPDFELIKALDDPEFLRLSAPHTGLSLSEAYYLLHREEIGRAAARDSLEKISRSIISGNSRPRESKDTAGSGYAPDYSSMSRSQREQLKKRIYEAGALGKKIYPGC